jgi:hypothetical protein
LATECEQARSQLGTEIRGGNSSGAGGKVMKRGSNPDSLCLEIQALSDFVCSNKIEILNVAGPRESKEPGVYDWTLKMFRLFLNWTASGAGSTETAGE